MGNVLLIIINQCITFIIVKEFAKVRAVQVWNELYICKKFCTKSITKMTASLEEIQAMSR